MPARRGSERGGSWSDGGGRGVSGLRIEARASGHLSHGAARVRFVAPRDDEASVEVCDIAGPRKGRWIVVGSAGTREVLIATAGWPPGLYAVRIPSRTGVATGRLIVAR